MTKIIDSKEVIEINNYIAFQQEINSLLESGKVEKAIQLYENFFKFENLFALSDISPLESLKNHILILINSLSELSIKNNIPNFIAIGKAQALIRMLSQKTEQDEFLHIGKIAIMGFGYQISLSDNKNTNKIIQKSLFYIHEHLDEKISLQEVADHVYLTKTYFSALFKEYVHMSFTDYINLSKVNRSKYYLVHSDKSISEIADLLGFSSQGYFTNIFKKYSRCSPKEYQLKHVTAKDSEK